MQPRLHERYRILERIGDGGAGIVYKVEDDAAGEVRALKVLPRATGRANLRSEFVALARLRHENIVSVFDYGLTPGGEDFFTMEYVEGPPLLEAGPPAGSEELYELVAGILRALAFVHARGMVHADIKPSNVLVDGSLLAESPERAARLADFGLAAAAGDPTAGTARGTFPYAAPEVYAGRLDARSDLYSLGVVLYELLTGHKPFEGDDVASVLVRQRRAAPADPRELAPEVPEALAELVLGLCDPAPGARPQTADEVAARMGGAAPVRFEAREGTPLLDFGAVLVGRERALGDLLKLWDSAKQGRGAAVLIAGEEGIGKSRLLAELKLEVQLSGGRALASSGDLPEGLVSHVASERLDPRSRYARAELVTSAILERAQREPLLLAVDDLEGAPPGTRELLGYVARAVPGSPVLLCLAARDAPALAGFEDAEGSERFDLPPLDRGSLQRLVEQTFSADIAEALAPDLHRASGGNPAHAGSALEAMVEAGSIARERGAWVLREERPEIPLPADLADAARARLKTLSPESREVLLAAAVLGERFDRDLLAAVLDETDAGAPDLDGALAEGARARLLTADATARRYRLGHRDLAGALAAELDRERRALLHRRAAEVLEGRAADGALGDPAELAEHYLALGDARAAPWALRAAEARAAAFDHDGALAWYRRALPLLEEGSEEARRAAETTGDLEALLGEVDRARESYERARAASEEPGERCRTARKLAELERRVGDGSRARDLLMAALEEARASALAEEEVELHLGVGLTLMYRAEYRPALEHAVAGQLMARSRGAEAKAAELVWLQGAIEVYQGEPHAALQHLRGAYDEARGTGDELLEAKILHEIGRAAIHAGDYEQASDALERAIAVFERARWIEKTAGSLNNLGAAAYFRGDWERARDSWEKFCRLCERLDWRTELITALNNLGSLYRDLGDLTEALAALDRAARIAERVEHKYMAAMVCGNRGEVLFRQGDLAGARDCFDRALAEFEAIDAREDHIETRRRQCALAVASGKHQSAIERVIDVLRDAKDAGSRLEEGVLHRIGAAAERLRGELGSAGWFLERSREILEELGARYELAKVDVEAGQVAAARGDRAEAEKRIRAAIETFSDLGARWDLTRARSVMRAVQPTAKMPQRGDADRGLALLLELAQATTNLEIDRVLERALDGALSLTGFDRGFILLLDEDGRPRERMRRVRSGAPAFARDEAEFSGSIVRKVAASREATAITDIADEKDFREQKSVIALGLRQVLCAPMLARGQVIGIVYMDSRRLSAEDHDVDLPLLEAFAAQMSLAVENHRMVTETRRKSELMAILAHEIRNPLSGILGYSSMGEDQTDDQEEAELFGRIHRDGERLRRLVDNVLELARHEAGELDWSFTAFDVRDTIEDAVAAFRPTCAQKEIELVVEADGLGRSAFGNPDRITQVLVNLVGNAVKFTPAKGTVYIAARRETVAAVSPEAPPLPVLGPDAWAPLGPDEEVFQDYIRVDVRDTGPGMTEENRQRLFEKFSQGGKGRSKGVGLGLYISREIVRRHGGSIWVESELGEGSTFSFRIPVAEPAP